MKRILCLIDGLGSGGAQRQLVGLAKLLKDKGYDVLFVWYHKYDFYRFFLEENGINYKQLETGNIFQKLIGINNTIREFRPDTVIAYIDGPTMGTCILKILGMKAQLIVSERNITRHLNSRMKIKFFLYRWADYVVSNSETQTNFIKKNFPSLSKKSLTIQNFVDTEAFTPPAHKMVDKGDDIEMLVVGRRTKQKNVLNFMRVIKKVQQNGIKLQVKWFGAKSDIEQSYQEEIEQVYNELDFGNTFLFYEPKQNIVEEYRTCDVFCLPSLWEGFPNVVCEAMSCGKPIICGNVSDNPYIVENGRNGLLFDPENIDDMVDKITQFCNLPLEQRKAMGEYSRALAIGKFSGENFVSKYISLIEN